MGYNSLSAFPVPVTVASQAGHADTVHQVRAWKYCTGKGFEKKWLVRAAMLRGSAVADEKVIAPRAIGML